jgi:hypothetical protein
MPINADEGGRSQRQVLQKPIRHIDPPQGMSHSPGASDIDDTMVIASPKLNAATVAAPNVNWLSWR